MSRIQLKLTIISALLLLELLVFGAWPWVAADTTSPPSLVVSQLKITSSNGQFITLYNTTGSSLDMSKYQIEYFNNYDLTKATSTRLIGLSGTLPAHSYYMVNDSQLQLCYQMSINSLSLGFSSTAGMIQVLSLSQTVPGASATPALQDYVAWTKTAANGAQTLPANTNAFLQRQPQNAQHNPDVIMPGSGTWQVVQPDPNNACNLITGTGTSQPGITGLNVLLPPTQPPATITSLDLASDGSDNGAVNPSLPTADIGLMSPQINELLPNPDGTGNDSTDEYIELYNPNDVSFDLSGFSLQTGITTFHQYIFPSGTIILPKSFVAYYSELTNLNLSNTSGQAKLLDPFGNSISLSQQYKTAKDGQAWALANGKWYWTTTLTPDKQNIIKQPLTAKSKASKSKTAVSKKSIPNAVKSSKTTAAKKQTGSFVEDPSKMPIHIWTLALVGALAILYGAYEYRVDLANRIYKFRRYFGFGRRRRV